MIVTTNQNTMLYMS